MIFFHFITDCVETKDITFILALKQRNLDTLERIYDDRTNPDSPNYRNWMSTEQINALVSPPKEVQQG
jgi:subtilase family serine protease